MPNGFLPAALATLLAAAAAAAADAPADLVKRSYPVADLVAPWPPPAAETPLGVFRPVTPPAVPPALPAPQAPTAFRVQAVAPAPARATMPANADKLVRLTTTMVKPYSWSDLGGLGTAAFDPARGELVICNTDDVHRDVSELLTALRKLQEKTTTQVVIEARIVEVPEAFFERLGAENLGRAADPAGADRSVLFLSDKEVRTFLEAVQADRRASVMMAPKMMACDGQPVVCRIGESMVFQTGLELTAGPGGVARMPRYEAVDLGTRIAGTPQVSADRRFVGLRFRYETATVGKTAAVTPVVVAAGGPEPGKAAPDLLSRPAVDRQVVEVVVSIPDGGTALIAGPRVAREERTEVGPPVLSNIPHLDRLFVARGIGRVEMRQLVLLSVRVVPSEKEVGGKCDCVDVPVPAPAAPPYPRIEKLANPPVAQCPAAGGCARPTVTDVLVQAAEPAGDCKSCRSLEAANLVKAYRKACGEGKTEEALKLAMQALALDPQCFAGK